MLVIAADYSRGKGTLASSMLLRFGFDGRLLSAGVRQFCTQFTDTYADTLAAPRTNNYPARSNQMITASYTQRAAMMIVRAFSRMACNRRIQGLSSEGGSGVAVQDWSTSFVNDRAKRTHTRTPPSHRIDTAQRQVNWEKCVSSRKRVRMLCAAELLHRAQFAKKRSRQNRVFQHPAHRQAHTLRKSGERPYICL